jgi:hypothetical protein
MRAKQYLAVAAVMAACGIPGSADTISDTITINLRNINKGGANPNVATFSIPEVPGVTEDVVSISEKDVDSFKGYGGYVLLCDGVKTCGPKDKFQNVSDIVARGVLKAANNTPAFFFWSDPSDPATVLKNAFDVDDVSKLPTPLGMLQEDGKAQDLSKYFGFIRRNVVVVTSTEPVKAADAPEPGTVLLVGLALVGLGCCRKRQSSAGRE